MDCVNDTRLVDSPHALVTGLRKGSVVILIKSDHVEVKLLMSALASQNSNESFERKDFGMGREAAVWGPRLRNVNALRDNTPTLCD
jgi:hypothetical protein